MVHEKRDHQSWFASRPVVLVTSRASVPKRMGAGLEERDTITPVDLHMPCGTAPLSYALALKKGSFSSELVQKSRVFVVNFIPDTLKGSASFCGSVSGRHVDKVSKSKLPIEEAEKVDCFRLKDAAAFLECHVTHTVDCGDHELFIGKVLHAKVRDGNARHLMSWAWHGE